MGIAIDAPVAVNVVGAQLAVLTHDAGNWLNSLNPLVVPSPLVRSYVATQTRALSHGTDC
jgi:hypothetical protein